MAAVAVLQAVLLASCQQIAPLNPDAGPEEPPRPSGAVCETDSEDTYETFGRAFFDAHCQSCHASSVRGAARRGAPSSYAFDDRASIVEDLEEIDELAAAGPAAVNRAMPPEAPRPSYEERLRLGQWLACGAP